MEEVKRPSNVSVVVVRNYYDLHLQKAMKVNDVVKMKIDRANELISKGFVRKK